MTSATTPIRFYLNGELVVVDKVSPTHTLLNYLRESVQQTGSKEGCAEGDCGACTVVIAELTRSGEVSYRGVNSCIAFLPTLDGRVVFTVEGLKQINGDLLHPVQTAMVTEHGSQCGFCTPGFVMTLFSMHQSRNTYDEDDARNSLAGNLCRCTGYRPILAAAQKALADDSFDRSALDDLVKRQLTEIATTQDKTLTFEGQTYFAPHSLEALLKLCDQYPNATLLAGGTDIGLWVTKQARRLENLIYIGNVDELTTINQTSDALEIRAAVTLSDAYPALVSHFPEMDEVLNRFASPGIRNSGTLCGNIANGSPIGDSMPCLIALEARIRLKSVQSERELALEDFYLGYQQKDLQSGEIVHSLILPNRSANTQFRAYKVAKRYDQDISAVLGAFAILIKNNQVQWVRVCFGGMAAVPQRALKTEQLLTGQTLSDGLIDTAAATLEGEYQPLTDMRASAAYRSQIAGNLLRRFFSEMQDDSPVSIWHPDVEAQA